MFTDDEREWLTRRCGTLRPFELRSDRHPIERHMGWQVAAGQEVRTVHGAYGGDVVRQMLVVYVLETGQVCATIQRSRRPVVGDEYVYHGAVLPTQPALLRSALMDHAQYEKALVQAEYVTGFLEDQVVRHFTRAMQLLAASSRNPTLTASIAA